MNRIRLLPDHVANQIAAGEVVERPASVVKELVENSLDAGAARITVEIAGGGRTLIRVTDDGSGMAKDDALLCLERHATSKIRSAEDLASIETMGFRGEAIPSIASVCRFTLTTRLREDATGEATQILISGGKILEVRAAPGPPGTTVEVRQLFFNLPARRKFLRSEETERAHIQHYVTLAALAHPAIGFTFLVDGRTVLQLPALRFQTGTERAAALQERIRQVHGGDTPLLPVEATHELPEDEPGGTSLDPNPAVPGSTGGLPPDPRPGRAPLRFRIWGFIGAPGVSRATRDEQHLFVNRRPVENRGLNFALIEGYHNALMKGRYPVCCLFIEIDPAAVDVNIHPSKREVKFRNEGLVRRWVGDAVRHAIARVHAPPSAPSAIAPGSAANPRTPAPVPTAPGVAHEQGHLGLPMPAIPAVPTSASSGTPRPEAGERQVPFEPPSARIPGNTGFERIAVVPTPGPSAPAPIHPSTAPGGVGLGASPLPLLQVPLRIAGVIGRLYVILESDRGLVLMDQHAAHERILYEDMLRRMEESGQAPQQKLLLPETVELSIRDAAFVRENLSTLLRLGVSLTEFGERTFLLDGLPPFVRTGHPKQFALALIDELKGAGAGVNAMRIGEDVVAKTVCRHAVKANDPLAREELASLLKDLRACAMPYTCPHGRPTLVEMSWRELERKFGRTA